MERLRARRISRSVLPFGSAADEVGAGAGAGPHPDLRDGVDGPVERPVAAAVEPVADGAAAARWDGTDAGEGCEGGVGSDPARVGEADDSLRGANRAGALAHSGRWRGVLCPGTDQPHLVDAIGRVVRALGGVSLGWRVE